MAARIRPSIRFASLPIGLPIDARFRLAAEIGFEGIELEVNDGPPDLLRAAAERAGLIIHSVSCVDNYAYPLSSGDPATLARGVETTLNAIETAHQLGAETLLLIPAQVDDNTSYAEALSRSRETIRREILPVAAARNVVLAVENVWNGFLLSPIDYVDYVDSFKSPFVRPYLDVGNIIFGRAEGWIDIAGPRIVKLHLKDFRFDWSLADGRFGLAKIGEGNVNWSRVRAALDRAGFSGWGTLAEPECIRGRNLSRTYYLLRRAMAELAPIPGARRGLAMLEAWVARRLFEDLMQRFRLHIAGR